MWKLTWSWSTGSSSNGAIKYYEDTELMLAKLYELILSQEASKPALLRNLLGVFSRKRTGTNLPRVTNIKLWWFGSTGWVPCSWTVKNPVITIDISGSTMTYGEY